MKVLLAILIFSGVVVFLLIRSRQDFGDEWVDVEPGEVSAGGQSSSEHQEANGDHSGESTRQDNSGQSETGRELISNGVFAVTGEDLPKHFREFDGKYTVETKHVINLAATKFGSESQLSELHVGNARVLGAAKQGGEDWHRERSSSLGGSDAAVVLGQEQYETRRELWKQKMGALKSSGEAQHTASNESVPIRFGRKFETLIIEYLKRLGEDDNRFGLFQDLRTCSHQLAHPKHDHMTGHVDGLLEYDGWIYAGVEIKTTGNYRLGSGSGVRPEHLAQVIHYQAITQLPRWFVVYFAPASRRREILERDGDLDFESIIEAGRLYVVEVDAHTSTISKLEEMESRFWNCVLEGHPPDSLPRSAFGGSHYRMHQEWEQIGEAYAELVRTEHNHVKPVTHHTGWEVRGPPAEIEADSSISGAVEPFINLLSVNPEVVLARSEQEEEWFEISVGLQDISGANLENREFEIELQIETPTGAEDEKKLEWDRTRFPNAEGNEVFFPNQPGGVELEPATELPEGRYNLAVVVETGEYRCKRTRRITVAAPMTGVGKELDLQPDFITRGPNRGWSAFLLANEERVFVKRGSETCRLRGNRKILDFVRDGAKPASFDLGDDQVLAVFDDETDLIGALKGYRSHAERD